ncbi:copper chaperone PCu(A)C [Szabonella alba]|uniref:Copper chaperone PCu(A)C n=1 Tax=Szabonella alba TaxID=2804194 RepID=A0A8K0VBZ5_9RHOB|nr:copper chaperone PCu(A)C [Szabonella alba]MBL4916375.1 copper chaperone PCu(A)C [Szabonella alba]
MTPILRSLVLGSALAALPLAIPLVAHAQQGGHASHAPAPNGSQEVQAGELHISGAFARATLPRAPVGGAYLTIRNDGAGDDRLTGVTAAVAPEVQIHMMEHKDGVMTMRQLRDGLMIPAGQSVMLEPGGFHLMLMGLAEPLVEGQRVEMLLQFEQAGEATVVFDIVALNARSAPETAEGAASGHEHSHGHNHGHDDATGGTDTGAAKGGKAGH